MAARRALEWIRMFEGLAGFKIWNIRLVSRGRVKDNERRAMDLPWSAEFFTKWIMILSLFCIIVQRISTRLWMRDRNVAGFWLAAWVFAGFWPAARVHTNGTRFLTLEILRWVCGTFRACRARAATWEVKQSVQLRFLYLSSTLNLTYTCKHVARPEACILWELRCGYIFLVACLV